MKDDEGTSIALSILKREPVYGEIRQDKFYRYHSGVWCLKSKVRYYVSHVTG